MRMIKRMERVLIYLQEQIESLKEQGECESAKAVSEVYSDAMAIFEFLKRFHVLVETVRTIAKSDEWKAVFEAKGIP